MAAVNSLATPGALDEAWERVADLRLRPRRTVHFYRHRYRGQPWLIIADQQGERYFRCSAGAEQFLRRLDGSHTVEQALSAARGADPADLAREDIVLLIGNLKAAGLLQDDGGADGGGPADARPRPNSWLRPFAIRIPLLDPDRWLRAGAHWFRPLFSPLVLAAWCAVVAAASVLGWLHWPALLEHGAARFADPQNLLWYWLLYPLVKALHELGHACATRAWGGAVREMGIMLLVFFPVPYVDSSAAHRFASKHRRIAVSAAGVMVEVLLAALALLLWVNAEPGLARDLAFDVILIGGVSTLLFNANPLLRFDGYYLLCELIEIPNLGTRAGQYLGYLGKRYLLGIPGQRSPVTAPGEAGWFVVYGIGAAVYRVFITLFIAFWVAGKFFVIGSVLALWAVFAQVVYPVARGLGRLIPLLARTRRLARFAGVLAAFALLATAALLVPTGSATYAEGVVDLPENALIRAGTDGIVATVLRADGDTVAIGDTVLELENPELEARRLTLLARLTEARARQRQAFLVDRSRADVLRTKVFSLEADLEDVDNQLHQLDVVAATAGIVSLPLASDLPGRYVSRGDVIGHVAGAGQLTALVVIPQADRERVRRDRRSIAVRLSGLPGQTFAAEFRRELPRGIDRLPDRRLGSAAGGEVAVDSRDDSGVQALANVFLVEIALPLEVAAHLLGQRVFVRFEHGRESLAGRLRRAFDRLMLQAPFV